MELENNKVASETVILERLQQPATTYIALSRAVGQPNNGGRRTNIPLNVTSSSGFHNEFPIVINRSIFFFLFLINPLRHKLQKVSVNFRS